MVSSSSSTNEVENEIKILLKIQSSRLVNLVGFTNDSKRCLLVVAFDMGFFFYALQQLVLILTSQTISHAPSY